MIISDLQFYDISWKHRFESLSLRKQKGVSLTIYTFFYLIHVAFVLL